MRLQQLNARRFRNLQDGDVRLDDGVNWFGGDNGQGKTNFLEAVYFLLTSKSFRTVRFSDLIRGQESDLEVGGALIKGKRTQDISVRIEDAKRSLFISGKPCSVFDYLQNGAAISFTARSKSLVEGSPDDRRRFIDRMVSYLEPNHMLDLKRYRRIQNQLRRTLIRDKDLRVYQSFKTPMAPVAERIARRRADLLESYSAQAVELYKSVFLGEGDLFFEYKTKNIDDFDRYQARILDVSAQELLHERALAGPHLDDLTISFRNNKAKSVASSGQIRAIVLSLKLAVREAYKNRFNYYPILLLDDIDAELDMARLKRLIDYLGERGQTLVSTSKYGIIEPWRGSVFEVKKGIIHRERKHE